MIRNVKKINVVSIIVFLFMFTISPIFAGETEECADKYDKGIISELVEIACEGPIDIYPSTEAISDKNEDAGKDDYDSEVLNVLVPTRVSIIIDPFGINGKDQIRSDTYEIINYGNSDVTLTFTDIKLSFADNENFEPLANPVDRNSNSGLKSIFMLLDFGRDDISPAVITDFYETNDIIIPMASAKLDSAEMSSVHLSFSGSVNELADEEWQDGDVSVTLTYKLESNPKPEYEILDILTDQDETKTDNPVAKTGIHINNSEEVENEEQIIADTEKEVTIDNPTDDDIDISVPEHEPAGDQGSTDDQEVTNSQGATDEQEATEKNDSHTDT